MRRFLIATFALFAALPAAAQDTQAFHGQAGYTVQLPAAWERMPAATVQALQQAGERAGSPYTMEAAFRATTGAAAFPYVAMAWLDLGQTLTPEQLAQAVTSAHGQAAMQQGADAMGAGARVDAPVWDAENRTVWVKSIMPPDGQAVTPWSLTASTLLPGGRKLVVFAYYAAPGEDDARARAALLAIVRSLRAD